MRLARRLAVFAAAATLLAAPAVAEDPSPLERGSYLVNVVGLCHDCHTPKTAAGELREDYLLAGHLEGSWEPPPWDGRSVIFAGDLTAAVGIWGAAFAKNLTPDADTGLGRWTREDFERAMRAGTRPDGTVLKPVMPWIALRGLTDEDLGAIWTYLQTVSPVRNPVPANLPTAAQILQEAP
jgi:hypothetical protein